MTTFFEDTKMVQHEIYNEMKQSYIDYAMSVIVSRALPDARDGLKPVHRRILYGMNALGIGPTQPHKKSARIVGEVMGKYHPHGDSSIYDAMVRLAQPWNMRYPMVDGHGNFGSIDGDGAAASRYTEARMTPFSLEMLRDIDKDTVDFVPNYDGEEQEPVVLPSRVPNLLINGSDGIAVGMATAIPPHNLSDTIDACVKVIDEPGCSIDDIIRIIKAPDFPTGGIIMGKNGAREAYRTGQGKVVVRSVASIEEGSRGKQQIIVTEIPFQVNKAALIQKMAELVKLKQLEGITEIRDESTKKEGLRIVIELKKDANAQIILNRLYKHTQLQKNVSMIMLAIDEGKPKILNIRQIIDIYLNHQKEVVTRRTIFDKKKAEARAHILEGYLIALDNIDEIIKIIRTSYDDAQQKLMDRFGLSEIQAKAILDMQLRRLQGLEREKIETEYAELMRKIAYYNELLADEHKLMGVVKDELLEVKKKWGDKRKTQIKADEAEIDEEDLIHEEDVCITLTHLGYAKRVPADTYRAQKRGGKGITGLTTRENDFVKQMIMCSSHDNLLFFTNLGKVHMIKAYEIPEGSRTAKGIPIVNFISLMSTERVTAVIRFDEAEANKFLICVTKRGTIKKTALTEYITNRKTGLIAVKLKEGDELIGVKQTTGTNNVIIVTRQGKCISFSEDDVRPMGRIAGGVRAIKLEGKDEVVSMELVDPSEELMVVTKKGYGKRTKARDYKIQVRGGKGLLTYDKSKFSKTGELVGAIAVADDDDVMLINSDGIIIRVPAREVSRLGRATQGVKIMNVSEDANIIAISKVAREDDVDDEPAEPANAAPAPREEAPVTESDGQVEFDL
ncbi:MAG: DNA gyrase subunit A [Firmicutes bacterium]|nr:DNA gyrase subunit A [Bacillota bacterium]